MPLWTIAPAPSSAERGAPAKQRDRDNPTAGGAGTVFIDDVGFGRPATGE